MNFSVLQIFQCWLPELQSNQKQLNTFSCLLRFVKPSLHVFCFYELSTGLNQTVDTLHNHKLTIYPITINIDQHQNQLSFSHRIDYVSLPSPFLLPYLRGYSHFSLPKGERDLYQYSVGRKPDFLNLSLIHDIQHLWKSFNVRKGQKKLTMSQN